LLHAAEDERLARLCRRVGVVDRVADGKLGTTVASAKLSFDGAAANAAEGETIDNTANANTTPASRLAESVRMISPFGLHPAGSGRVSGRRQRPRVVLLGRHEENR
jgi:hypothetical protein